MKYKLMYRVFAGLSFIVSLITYLLTVQPSVPFWDCGEFSSAAIWQQVPHPPGAPLFLLLGKLFHIIIPFGDQAWRINMVSVVASAVTIFLLYIITVKVIENFLEEPIKDFGHALAVYGSAFVGAAAFTFSDTFWFNAVESEVYATSTLFVALIVYLMMRWNEKADEPGHERYLLLIFYLIGLSIGVHLLSILTIFSIVLTVYYRKYEVNLKSFIVMGIIALVTFFIVYPFVVKYIPAFLAGHTPNKTEAREYAVEDSIFLVILAYAFIVGVLYLVYYTWKKNMRTLNLASLAIVLMLLGYTTYTQILLRSNANPPMNENEPENFSKLSSYLGREQYGNAPMWPRRYHTDSYYTQRYNKRNDRGEYIYGRWNPPSTETVFRSDGQRISVENWTNVNVSGELNYMWKYQISHMYLRYFAWNFIGRMGDIQDRSPVPYFTDKKIEKINYGSGYKDIFPINFYLLPFLFGLWGIIYHFSRDKRMAFIYLVLFLVSGVLMALQQNQQEPQPRERHYFYAASFMVWALWIGVGTYGAIESLLKKKISAIVASVIIIISLFAVPVNMAAQGWFMHSRAGNYIPFDYSYNILQSTEENAIIFTNGDNDTFPLWYLQDVAGVRRDVRVVNLSLGNTLWYIDQLKNREPWGAEKIPLSFSDQSLNVDEMSELALSYDFGEPRNVEFPVKKEIIAQYTDNEALINRGTFQFTWKGKPYGEQQGRNIHIFRIQDKLIKDIIEQVRFERPVYFSNTVGPDAYAGLQEYFRLEGMAMRICPVKQGVRNAEALDPEIMEKCLLGYDNTNNFHKEPNYGFKFRNLNNRDVYYDHVHRRLSGTYRTLYLTYAVYAMNVQKDMDKTVEILDTMNELISVEQFPLNVEQAHRIAQIYSDAGADDQMNRFAEIALKEAEYLQQNPDIESRFAYSELMGRGVGPYRYASMLYVMKGQYDKAIMTLEKFIGVSESYMQQMQNNPAYKQDVGQINYSILDARSQIDEFKIRKIAQEEGLDSAMKFANQKLNEYQNSREQQMFIPYLKDAIKEVRSEYTNNDTVSALMETGNE